MANSQTVIGATIVINGEFKSQEDVSIRGKIQGRIETTADLFVEEGGTVEAEVATRNIDVRGTIVGNVHASDRFELHPEGSLTGDIHAPRVVVADGGRYKGRVDMDPNSSARTESALPTTPRPTLRRR
jgi:cytoskeletal protein CcmA (bactofilin family)